jgi:cytochrome c peroxidase
MNLLQQPLKNVNPPGEMVTGRERGVNTMRKGKTIKLSAICGAILGTSIVCSSALAQVGGPALGQVAGPIKNAIAGPLPPPVMAPDEIALTPVEKLGKFMLYDDTLSNPPGYACATCHVPEAGFTGPDSLVNQFGGPQPGVVPGRFGNRKPQSYVYAAFSPVGPFFNANKGVWIGGDFWDGRVPDLSGQAKQPPINPNEMNNTPVGPFPPVQGGFSQLLAEKLKSRPYTPLFLQVYGQDAFAKFPPQQIYELFALAVAAYESTGEVNGFSSKYDASKYGTPAQNLYTLSASEERGRQLYFGQAQCFQCHSSAALPNVTLATQGKETFTMYCYANIGVPRNVLNPYYQETDPVTNPHGFNPLGTNYIDYGLGSNPNPAPDGTRFFNNVPGDIPQFRGLFKTPSNRDVDTRTSPNFVKAYMHNGVFKSLQEVVHFYNKRNIAVNASGQEIAFDLRKGPPAGYTRLFPPPEVLDNVQNVAGVTPAQATAATASNGQVGNLQLSAQQEQDLVNFLAILSDGFTKPNPVSP